MVTAYGIAGKDMSYMVNQEYSTVAREVVLYSPRVEETVDIITLNTALDRFGPESEEYRFCRAYWAHNNGMLKISPVSKIDDWVKQELEFSRLKESELEKIRRADREAFGDTDWGKTE